MDSKVREMANRLRENHKRNQNDFELQIMKNKKRIVVIEEMNENTAKVLRKSRHKRRI